jgi:two-component system chemotaxis response regulator CheY
MSVVESKEKACRVLIIEDDYDDVFLLKRALADVERILNRKIECEHVDNGRDAVFVVSKEDQTDKLPDALILDLNMPKLNGIEFLRALRKSLQLKDLPVFVLTTTEAPSIHEEAIRAGADRVYVKPNDAETLGAIALEMIVATLNPRPKQQGAS